MQSCTTPLCDLASLAMTALQLGQFIPQHVSLYTDKSIVGLSPWMLFFSSLYNYFAALDLVLVDLPLPNLHPPTSPAALSGSPLAPASLSPFRYFMACQPAIQLVGSALLTALMWPYYLLRTRPADRPPAFSLYLVSATVASLVAVAVVILPLPAASPALSLSLRETYATACGLMAALANTFMWLPQIALTARLHSAGSLSPLWVALSVASDLVYIAYLAARGVHWSVWANNVPDAVFASTLLILLARYDHTEEDHDTGNRSGTAAALPTATDVEMGPCTRSDVGADSGKEVDQRLFVALDEERVPLLSGRFDRGLPTKEASSAATASAMGSAPEKRRRNLLSFRENFTDRAEMGLHGIFGIHHDGSIVGSSAARDDLPLADDGPAGELESNQKSNCNDDGDGDGDGPSEGGGNSEKPSKSHDGGEHQSETSNEELTKRIGVSGDDEIGTTTSPRSILPVEPVGDGG